MGKPQRHVEHCGIKDRNSNVFPDLPLNFCVTLRKHYVELYLSVSVCKLEARHLF